MNASRYVARTPESLAEPIAPDDSYLREVAESTRRGAATAIPFESEFAGADAVTRDRARRRIEDRADDLRALGRALHGDPEEGFAEHRSVARVAELLTTSGHPPSIGIAGLETAFSVTVGESGPHVAVLAEYDALPGIGHGCGHNIICAAAVGAFLGAAEIVREVGGRLSLVGTPAEEGGGGKELLARSGVFDEVDAALMLHPFSHDIADHPFLGRRQVEIVFHGIAAHASAEPFMGRNALDAVVNCYQSISALRQHLPPSDRVHGIITDGGARPNVIPERAAASYYLRSGDPGSLADLARRVEAVAHGAAEATGCGVELFWDERPAYLPIKHNRSLVSRWVRHQAALGRNSLPRGVVPEHLTGSTDLGNLSRRMPCIHPMIGLEEENLSLHTTEFARAAGGEAGDRAIVDGAIGLGATAADYLADPELRGAVHLEFRDS